MSSTTNNPTASPTSSSPSIPSASDAPDELISTASPNVSDRPHAPVAKTLNKQELKHALSTSPSPSELIPNLLHSGKFPPPPRSPRHSHHMSHSPPPIQDAMTSPVYPAAPPGTPYSPKNKAGPSLPNGMPLSPGASAIGDYKLGHRPSPPEDEHYHTLLKEYQSKALAEEKARIANLKQHEDKYTTVDEYKHALARERRHILTLVQELSLHKFNSRYQSCQLYSEAEINEEHRVNLLIKNMEGIIKEKNEEKVRTVMELEREEERMINVLMERLERVNREKGMLERQIYGSGSGAGLSSRFESMEGVEFVVPNPTVRQQQSDPCPIVPKLDVGDKDTKQTKAGDDDIAEDDEEEEEEENDNDQDILDDKFHDPDMEMELNNLLKKKGC